MSALIDVKDLTKVYSDGTHALRGISFSVERGEFAVVIGRSGAGKSTLLRCINGLVDPTSGEVAIDGSRLTGLPSGKLRVARRELGFIFQQFNLVRRLTALENVLCGRLARMSVLKSSFRRFSKLDKLAALECLERVGLADKAWQRADTLSGGQQQRVAIARALAQEPKVILADEPVASLDPESSRVVMDTLRSLSEEGLAVVCNLHQVNLAGEYADRLIGVRDGELVLDGLLRGVDQSKIDEVYQAPAREMAR
jgi:phosphonate transport system ATP-binding protein